MGSTPPDRASRVAAATPERPPPPGVSAADTAAVRAPADVSGADALALSSTLVGAGGLPPDAVQDGMEPPPRQLGKYRILRELGEGGMSVVYLAADDALDRKVAVKLLHRHLARDPEARARLTREARASARLRHPNIPEILDFTGSDGGDGGRGFIVSEFVDGWSLADLLRRHPPPLPEIGVALVLRVAEALAHAHREGVIHRDVKPENILVGRDGVVKLTDFGIAHVVGGDAMTMTGTLLGSPLHMAPEQIRGERGVDARVDVWGFGTVLFMAVTGGRHAFEGGNPHVVMRRILDGEREDVRRLSPHVDSELAAVIDDCLAVDRGRRPSSIDAVVSRLETWLAARGADDVEAVAQGFTGDPEGFARLFSRGLVGRLLQLAEAAPTPDAAIELLGRVLLLDPGHREAEASLRRRIRALRGNRAMRRTGLGLFAAAAVAVGMALLWPTTDGPDGPLTRPVDPRPVGTPAMTDVTEAPPHAELAEVVLPGSASDAVPGASEPEDSMQLGLGTDLAGESAFPDVALGAGVALDAGDAGNGRQAEGASRARSETVGLADRPAAAVSTVEARITVYPPAVRVRVAGLAVRPGVPFHLPQGRVEAVFTHPGCPSCGDDVRTLDVRPDTDGRWSTHVVFSRGAALAPARLSLRCPEEGGWVEGPDGTRYACNRDHAVPVSSEQPTLVEFIAYDARGQRVGARRFNLRPAAPIVWQL